jgi:hypothetical protein
MDRILGWLGLSITPDRKFHPTVEYHYTLPTENPSSDHHMEDLTPTE